MSPVCVHIAREKRGIFIVTGFLPMDGDDPYERGKIMYSIEDFGASIERLIHTDPEKARKRLLLGYRAYGAKLRAFPDKRLPVAKRHSAVMLNRIMQTVLAKPEETVLVNIFMPGELITSMGLTPMCAELFSGFINGTASEHAFAEAAHREGIAETFCSYHKVVLGAAYTGVLPKPKAIVNTSFICDANQLTFRELEQTFDIPHYYVDIPNDASEDAIQYVADEFREVKAFLEDVTGTRLDEDALRETVGRADETIRLYREVLALKRDRVLPSDVTSELYETYLMHNALGTRMSQRYVEELLDAYRTAPARTGKKILWLHTIPNWQRPVVEAFNFHPRYDVITTDLNVDALIPLDPQAPYESMAKRLLMNHWNGGQNRVAAALATAKELDVEGVICFCQWGCKETMGLVSLFENAFDEAQIPLLVLDGDGVDRRNASDGQTETRIGAFLELLEADRHGSSHVLHL